MSRQELVSPEVLGSDEELRAAARQAPAQPAPEDEAEGRDPARAVVVRVDRRGQVTDVLISAWWRDDLTPAGLQAAVLSAYQAALARATAGIHAPAAGGAPVGEPAGSPDDDYEGDDYSWLVSVRRRLDRAEEALAHSGELLHEGTAPQRMISGPAGLVRLVLTGQTVAEVLIDARTALQESPNRLAADALAAFQSIG
jgi:hypothetical protein